METSKILQITNGKEIVELNFDELEFTETRGDYFYVGTNKGCKIAFSWDNELGEEYIKYILLGVNRKSNNDFEFVGIKLTNLEINRLFVALSDIEFDLFKKWLNEADKKKTQKEYNDDEITKLETLDYGI